MSAFNLGLIFTAKDLASSQINTLQNNFSNLDKTITGSQRNFQKNVAAFGVGMGIMAAGAKVASLPLSFVQVAGDFQKSMAKMGAATKYPEDQMKLLEEKALDLGVATQFDPEQAVSAMKQIGSSGMTAAQTLKIVDSAVGLAGASMGQLGMEGAAGTVVAALKSFNIEASQSAAVADKLGRITQISNLTFPELERVIGSAGGAASKSNQDLSTMLATIGMFKLQGGTAINAAQKFRMALENLPKASAAKGLKAIGLTVEDLMKNGKMIALPDVFDKIKGGLDGITASNINTKVKLQTQALQKMFGQNGAELYSRMMKSTFKTASGAVLKGTDAMRANINEVNKSLGTNQEANDNYLKTLPGIMDLMEGTGQTIKLVLGKSLIADLSTALQFFLDNVLNKVLGFLKDSPKFTSILTKGLLGVGTTLMVVGGLISGFAGFAMLKALFITAGISITGSLSAIGTALATAFLPVTIAAAVVAGGVLAWQNNFLGFRDFLEDLFSDIKTSFSLFSEGFTSGFDLSGIAKEAGPVLDVLKQVFTDLALAVSDVVGEFSVFESSSDFSGAASSGQQLGGIFNNFIIPAIKVFGSALAGAVKVVTFLVDVFGSLGGVGQNVVFGLIAVFNPFIGIPLLIAKNWGLITGVFDVFSSGIAVVGVLISSFVQAIIDLPQSWQTTIDFMSEIFSGWGASLQSGIEQIGAFFSGLFSSIVSFVSALPGEVLNQILNIPAYIIGGFAVIGIIAWEMGKMTVDAFAFVATSVFNLGAWFTRKVIEAIVAIPSLIAGAYNMIKSGFITIMTAMWNYAGIAVSGIMNFFAALPSRIFNVAVLAGTFFVNGLSSAVGAVVSIVSSIGGFFLSLPSTLINIGIRAGKGLINAIHNGISSQVNRIKNTLRSMVQGIRNLLPGSDAKEGPLSDLTHSGTMLPRTFALGIEKASEEPADAIEQSVNVSRSVDTQTVANILPPQLESNNSDIVQAITLLAASIQQGNSKPISAILKMDGDVLAQATQDIEDDEIQRSFIHG